MREWQAIYIFLNNIAITVLFWGISHDLHNNKKSQHSNVLTAIIRCHSIGSIALAPIWHVQLCHTFNSEVLTRTTHVITKRVHSTPMCFLLLLIRSFWDRFDLVAILFRFCSSLYILPEERCLHRVYIIMRCCRTFWSIWAHNSRTTSERRWRVIYATTHRKNI